MYAYSFVSVFVSVSVLFSTVFFNRRTIFTRNFGIGVPNSERFSRIEINSLMMSQIVTIKPQQYVTPISTFAAAKPVQIK